MYTKHWFSPQSIIVWSKCCIGLGTRIYSNCIANCTRGQIEYYIIQQQKRRHRIILLKQALAGNERMVIHAMISDGKVYEKPSLWPAEGVITLVMSYIGELCIVSELPLRYPSIALSFPQAKHPSYAVRGNFLFRSVFTQPAHPINNTILTLLNTC